MRYGKTLQPLPFIAFLLAICLPGCRQLTPLFDSQAYNYAISLKVESAFLMKKAMSPYSEHADDIEELQKEIQKAYLYEKGRGEVINSETLQLWIKMMDENGALLGGFLKRWRDAEGGRLGQAIIENMTGQVGEAFDEIIRVENGRRREAFDLGKAVEK